MARAGAAYLGWLSGYLQQEWRMASESATWHRTADAEEEETQTEPPVRDTKHAVRVLLYKLIHQKLPPDLGRAPGEHARRAARRSTRR